MKVQAAIGAWVVLVVLFAGPGCKPGIGETQSLGSGRATGGKADASASDATADAGQDDPGPAVSTLAECGEITFEGCCDGTTLRFCDDGVLWAVDCSQAPACGWEPEASYYDCTQKAAADPSGAAPRECPRFSTEPGGLRRQRPARRGP